MAAPHFPHCMNLAEDDQLEFQHHNNIKAGEQTAKTRSD